jgi:hypothetical protein
LRNNVRQGRPPFENCGSYSVYSQLDWMYDRE